MMRAMLYEAAQSHDAFQEMVLAQGLSDADRQAPRHEEGNRGAGTSAGRDAQHPKYSAINKPPADCPIF